MALIRLSPTMRPAHGPLTSSSPSRCCTTSAGGVWLAGSDGGLFFRPGCEIGAPKKDWQVVVSYLVKPRPRVRRKIDFRLVVFLQGFLLCPMSCRASKPPEASRTSCQHKPSFLASTLSLIRSTSGEGLGPNTSCVVKEETGCHSVCTPCWYDCLFCCWSAAESQAESGTLLFAFVL